MDSTYWRKQTHDTPLFQDILWSRPESKSFAGKLALVGGNGHGFSVVGNAYTTALDSGVGVVKALMPDAVFKAVGRVLPDAEFAPSNPSGGFSKKALSSVLSIAEWGDACLLAGNFGRNSETAVLMEEFVKRFSGLLTITHDAVDYFKATPRLLLEREHTLVVLSLAQLQKFFINVPLITPITYSMTPLQLAEALHALTIDFSACISVKHQDTVYTAYRGTVISTESTAEFWRVTTATRATVFWLQNPTKILESVISSMYRA